MKPTVKPALPAIAYPRAPAHIQPFVEVLGPALALRFLLRFGGANVYYPTDPGGRSKVEAMIGAERLRALGERMQDNRVRVPIGNAWVCTAPERVAFN